MANFYSRLDKLEINNETSIGCKRYKTFISSTTSTDSSQLITCIAEIVKSPVNFFLVLLQKFIDFQIGLENSSKYDQIKWHSWCSSCSRTKSITKRFVRNTRQKFLQRIVHNTKGFRSFRIQVIGLMTVKYFFFLENTRNLLNCVWNMELLIFWSMAC